MSSQRITVPFGQSEAEMWTPSACKILVWKCPRTHFPNSLAGMAPISIMNKVKSELYDTATCCHLSFMASGHFDLICDMPLGSEIFYHIGVCYIRPNFWFSYSWC